MSKSILTAALLAGTVSLISLDASAHNSHNPPAGGTELLHSQMQAAAAAAAGAQAAAPPAVPNPNCTLLVPDNPLSAKGLATPYQLVATDPAQGPCNESNAGQSAFVQGAIFDPATGAISVYNPLVIDKGDTPLVAPVPPVLPEHAIIATWFGFNGTNLLLQSGHLSLPLRIRAPATRCLRSWRHASPLRSGRSAGSHEPPPGWTVTGAAAVHR